jgi:predicted RNase H-like nuclease (RuvC/YqgF family)
VETLKTKGCNFGDARWMDLGLALGLYHSTIKQIQLDCNGSHDCLVETLDKWMRRADNVMSKGRPSWDTLADALRRIDENTSAQYITEQRMRLEALSASNDAVRDGAIINVVKDASLSLVDQNIMKIDELMEKMESIASKPQEDINHQLMEMKKEIKQLNEINEQLKVHLDELNQLKNKLQETDLAKKQMSHDLDKYRSLYESKQSNNRYIM